MSYYYSYYLGIEDKSSGLIQPFGPYDSFGKLNPIFERSRSFASDLHEDFREIPSDMISQELRKEFEYEDWQGNKKVEVNYLPFDELPIGDYIIRGYFPIEDYDEWVKFGGSDICDNVITPEKYAELLKKELIFGKNKPEIDEEGYEYTELNASDYIFSAIPNYSSKEYEAVIIREVANMLFSYELRDKYELVVLETEG